MASAKAKAPETRRDPRQRAAGAPPIFELNNADPNRKYCWVALSTPAEGQGVEYYELAGYKREVYGTDLPCPRGITLGKHGRMPGDEIVIRGALLMSIEREQYERIVREGVDGDTGLQRAEEREAHIIKRRGIYDPLRGMNNLHGRSGGSFVSVREYQGGISPAYQEQ